MKEEVRTVVYDEELRLEAYHFEGIVQPFPNHFHEYYVIGFVERGQRMLHCRNKEYIIEKDCIVLFNPGDNHACTQSDGGRAAYMRKLLFRGRMGMAVPGVGVCGGLQLHFL